MARKTVLRQDSMEGLSPTFTCSATEQVGDLVYVSGDNAVAQADASDEAKSEVLGYITHKPTSTTCRVSSQLGPIPGSSLTQGEPLYLSATTPGSVTHTSPSSPNVSVPIGYAVSSSSWVFQKDLVSSSTASAPTFKYFPITAHDTYSLTQSRASGSGQGTTGPFEYTFSGFTVTGSGYDSTKVFEVFVYCAFDCDSCEYRIEATFPDGTYQTLLGTSPGPTSVSDENSPHATLAIPVTPGQSSVSLRIRILSDPAAGSGTDSGLYTIVALRQFG